MDKIKIIFLNDQSSEAIMKSFLMEINYKNLYIYDNINIELMKQGQINYYYHYTFFYYKLLFPENVNRILQVKTGDSEYNDTIGKLGEFIVVEQMHGTITRPQ